MGSTHSFFLGQKGAASFDAGGASAIFVIAIAAYFCLHVVLRVVLSGSLELDEAEAVFLAQELRAGYGSQPPLYTWLQSAMFSVFGLNLFSLAALKNLLLFATYLSVFFTARPLVGTGPAIAASASLILFPQIGWESQRDLTHSVLLTALASATLWAYFALLRAPRAGRYVLFGLLIGLGVQTKYNFVVFLAGLVIASLLVASHRRAVWNRNVALTAAAAIVAILPHGVWLVGNLEAVRGGSLHELAGIGTRAGYLQNVVSGVTSLGVAALAFVAPAALALGFAARRHWRHCSLRRDDPHARFFVVLYVGFFVLLTLIVLTGGVAKVKDRWMQPLLFSLPLALFVMMPDLRSPAVVRSIVRVAGAVAFAVMLLLSARVLVGPAVGKYVRPHHPYPQLAAELARRFPHAQLVVGEDRLIAGNLHFERPAWRTVLLDDVLERGELPVGEALVVAHDDIDPAWIARFRAAYPQGRVLEQGRLTFNYRFGGHDTLSFRYAVVAPAGRE